MKMKNNNIFILQAQNKKLKTWQNLCFSAWIKQKCCRRHHIEVNKFSVLNLYFCTLYLVLTYFSAQIPYSHGWGEWKNKNNNDSKSNHFHSIASFLGYAAWKQSRKCSCWGLYSQKAPMKFWLKYCYFYNTVICVRVCEYVYEYMLVNSNGS